jgi:glycosyltransferase involved in cell wall biosynthesis
MKVAYYTSAYFIDSAIETIQSIKSKVSLHLYIEVSDISKKSTILNIESIESFDFIEDAEKVLGPEQWTKFKPYFEGITMVKFIVHKNSKSLSIGSFFSAMKLGKYFQKMNFDIMHFDNISQRSFGLYPFLNKTKLVITLHDPKPHTGENSWKTFLKFNLFIPKAKAFILYAEFSKTLLKKVFPKVNVPINCIQLLPFSFMRNYLPKEKISDNSILFFGRLSPYKGIDLLLNAIPLILEKYPNQQFVVAGSTSYDFKFDEVLISKIKNNVTIINKYLSLEEIASLIDKSAFVVCPYRDATQSGVLSTTFAFGKTAIVSNVGSFGEYIKDGINGLISEPETIDLSKKIMQAIENDYYKQLEANVISNYSSKKLEEFGNVILSTYENVLKG